MKIIFKAGGASHREAPYHHHEIYKMKRIFILHLIIFFLYSSAFIYAEKAEKDVSIVKNNPVPRFGSLDLQLKEEIIFDISKDRKGYYAYWIKDMVLDSEENIHLIANDYIFKLNGSGELLKAFKMKQGQGPGEFQGYLQRIYRDNFDNLYIYDMNKLIVFDKNMSFKKNLHIWPSNSLYVDNKSFIYTMKRIYTSSELHKVLSKFDRDGRLLKEFKNTSYYECKITGKTRLTLRHEYSPKGYFCFDSDNHIIYANSLEYKLYKYDLEGNLLSMIIVDEKPQKITSKEKYKITEGKKSIIRTNYKIDWNLYFPKHRPFFKGIFIDEKDRIYAFHIKSVLEENNEEIVDIFSKDGRYLYKTKLPCFPKIIRNGSIYLIDKSIRDENGDRIYKIKKFSIKNYDSIKY